MNLSNPKKVFLYTELQASRPFTEVEWRKINPAMEYENGLSEFVSPLKLYGESDGKDAKLTETLRGLMKPEGTKFQYAHGARNSNALSPDT